MAGPAIVCYEDITLGAEKREPDQLRATPTGADHHPPPKMKAVVSLLAIGATTTMTAAAGLNSLKRISGR